MGLAEATISNLGQLKDRYKLTTDPILFESTWVDTLVAILNFPWSRELLLVLGLIFLYVEFYIRALESSASFQPFVSASSFGRRFSAARPTGWKSFSSSVASPASLPRYSFCRALPSSA